MEMEPEMSNLLITSEEMVMIKKSNAAKDMNTFGNLYSCLLPYQRLSECDLHKNDILDEKARSTILNNKSMLLTNCNSEWTGSALYDETEDSVKCQLCGQPNFKLFYITNSDNGNELHIGSSCISKFKILDSSSIRLARKDFKIRKQHRDEDQRRIEFDTHETDYTFIKRIENNFNTIDILLPFDLITTLKNLLYELNNTRTSYIKHGGDKEIIFNQYDAFKKSYLFEWEKAILHYNENKDNPLVCNRAAANWLLLNKNDIYEKVSKNNGIFEYDTLLHVYEETFIKDKLSTFKHHIANKKELKLQKYQFNQLYFTIKNDTYPVPLPFRVRTDWFMSNIGSSCLTDTNYKFSENNLKEGLRIDFSLATFDVLYNALIDILLSLHLDLEYDSSTDYIYLIKIPDHITNPRAWRSFKNTNDVLYKRFRKDILINKIASVCFESPDRIKCTFNMLARNRDNWISKADKDNFASIANNSLQKQKEFI